VDSASRESLSVMYNYFLTVFLFDICPENMGPVDWYSRSSFFVRIRYRHEIYNHPHIVVDNTLVFLSITPVSITPTTSSDHRRSARRRVTPIPIDLTTIAVRDPN
jgi:hypothetical protein